MAMYRPDVMAIRLMERRIMKSNQAKAILGDDRITDLFLQGNSASVSQFVRQLLMQAKFYYIKPENIARFLHDEVLWQEQVFKAYSEHCLASNKLSVETQIAIDSNSIF